MNPVTKAPISKSAKIFIWIAIVIGTIHITDFIFYGQEVRNLLAGIGFALMAFGIHRNGFGHARAVADHRVAVDVGGRYATLVGTLLVLASIVLRFSQ